jgi:hypothetical protein
MSSKKGDSPHDGKDEARHGKDLWALPPVRFPYISMLGGVHEVNRRR